MTMLKYLHFKHFQHNGKMIFNDLLIDRDFFRNDFITCVWYYEHIMNCSINYFERLKSYLEKLKITFS
jgi:hypothetical protein